MDMTRFLLPAILSALMATTSVHASSSWTDVPDLSLPLTAARLAGEADNIVASRYLRADMVQLRNELAYAPLQGDGGAHASIALPMPNGEMHEFLLEESPVMSYGLASEYPDFKTYRVRSKSTSTTGRLDMLPTGFHAYLMTQHGTVFIDPDPDSPGNYHSYYKHDQLAAQARVFACGVSVEPLSVLAARDAGISPTPSARIDNELLTYRIAVGATYEYTRAVVDSPDSKTQMQVKTETLAEIVTAINRVNEIYNRDVAIHLELIGSNMQLISTVQGELTDDDPFTLISQAQDYIEAQIDAADYDIGHIFSTGGGGLAGLGVVCSTSKADGVTGIPDPKGDAYYIDYVAHEIGHQFGANHTFNGTTGSCGGSNRNASTAYEPGSGSTIMAYAGICGDEDIQSTALSTTAGGISEDTFHAGTIAEIYDFSRIGGGSVCSVVSAPGNSAPNADAGSDYTIPGLTPFELTGSATDVDVADTLSYQWDEMDTGTATDATSFGSDLGDNALFRSFAPSDSETRVLPRLDILLSGGNDKAERLPSLDRTMNFRLTVRDQNGGVDEDDMQVEVDQGSGPFRVLSLAQSVTLDVDQDHVIEWNAACTEQAPVNCADVDILLSEDGGLTFPHSLAAATANDGSETVSLPVVTTTQARVRIQCSNNIFFDINDADIALAQGSGVVLASTGSGGSYDCGTGGTAGDVGDGTTGPGAIDVSNAIAVDLSSPIQGSINDLASTLDIYQFSAEENSFYVFTLQDYGDSDLDLHLTDDTGNIITQSTGSDITETIRVNLVGGETYYLVVSAPDTGGLTQSYTIETTITERAARAASSDDDSGLGLNPVSLLLLAIAGLLRSRRVSDR